LILVLVVALVLVLVQALVWVLTGLGFHKYHYLTNVMVRPLPPPYPHFKVGGDIHRCCAVVMRAFRIETKSKKENSIFTVGKRLKQCFKLLGYCLKNCSSCSKRLKQLFKPFRNCLQNCLSVSKRLKQFVKQCPNCLNNC
jgi:hypothetical protein